MITNFICFSSEKMDKESVVYLQSEVYLAFLGGKDIFNEYQIMFIHKHQFYVQYNKINSIITKVVLFFFYNFIFPFG